MYGRGGLADPTAAVSALTAKYYPANYINVGTATRPIMVPPSFGNQDTSIAGSYAQNEAADESGQIGGTDYTWPDGTVHNFEYPPELAAVSAMYVPGVGSYSGSTPFYQAIDYGTGDITVDGHVVANFTDPAFDAPALHALVVASYLRTHPDDAQTVANGPAIHIDPGVLQAQPDPTKAPSDWHLGTFNGSQGYWGPDGKFHAGATPWLDANSVGVSINDQSGGASTPTPGSSVFHAAGIPSSVGGVSTTTLAIGAAIAAFLLFRRRAS